MTRILVNHTVCFQPQKLLVDIILETRKLFFKISKITGRQQTYDGYYFKS